MNKSAVVVLLSTLGLSSVASAEIDWYANVAFASGGDDLAKVEVEYYGGDTDDVDITAGGGFSLSGGGMFDLGEQTNWKGITTLGYKFDGVSGRDGDSAEFDRFVVDALAVYQFPKVQFGAGVTYEFDLELDLKDINLGTTEFDNALGFIVQVDWRVTEMIMLGLRYTAIEYEASNINNVEIDGNNFSLRAGIAF